MDTTRSEHMVHREKDGRDWAEPFGVGDWRVEPSLNRLSHGQKHVQIEPKIMAVLLYLACHQGVVLSHDDLLGAVWADTVVGRKVLSRAVFELRKVFEDDATTPRYIETIPRRGYRLIAPVSTIGSRQVSAEKKVVARRPGRWAMTGAAVVGVALAALAWPQQPDPPAALEPVPFTTYAGREVFPAFSWDGERMAFSWDAEGTDFDLYVKQANEETPLKLTSGPANDVSPVWSPDGLSIAFLRIDDEGPSINVVPAVGGPIRKVKSLNHTILTTLTWSPDGTGLAYADKASQGASFAIFLHDLASRETQRLTQPPGGSWGDYDPIFSPDGTRLAFIRALNTGERDLYSLSLAGEAPRQLTFDDRFIAGVDWTPDGRELVFASDRGGTTALWRIPLSGGSPSLLSVQQQNVARPIISREKGRLAFVVRQQDVNIWLAPLSGSEQSTGSGAVPVLTSTRWDAAPHFSPDGRRVAFVSDRSGSFEVWLANRDGSAPVQMTFFEDGLVAMPAWSPDGRFLVFEVHQGEQADLFVLDTEGGGIRRLTQSDGHDWNPTWSPDGAHIFFTSNREGTWEIWRITPEGEQPRRLTEQSGYYALASADGQSLYYARYQQEGLWKRDLSTGIEEQVLDGLAARDWGNWALWEEGISFITRPEAGQALLSYYDFATAEIRPVAPLEGSVVGQQRGLTISPDRRWLLYARVDRSDSDIMMVGEF